MSERTLDEILEDPNYVLTEAQKDLLRYDYECGDSLHLLDIMANRMSKGNLSVLAQNEATTK